MPTDRDFNRQETILLVDDDAFLRGAIATILRVRRFTTIEADSGEEALDLLTSNRSIDLVLCDVHLSGALDGLALARWMSEHLPRLPLILITGRADLIQTELPAPLLTKPFSTKKLLSLIKRALDGTSTAP